MEWDAYYLVMLDGVLCYTRGESPPETGICSQLVKHIGDFGCRTKHLYARYVPPSDCVVSSLHNASVGP